MSKDIHIHVTIPSTNGKVGRSFKNLKKSANKKLDDAKDYAERTNEKAHAAVEAYKQS